MSGVATTEAPPRHGHGTVDWLIEQYKRLPRYMKLRPGSRKSLNHEFERLSRDYGTRRFAGLRPETVEVILARKADTPAAANRLLKLLRRLAKLAIKKELITRDPTLGVERYAERLDGWHVWTDAEIEQFERHHGVTSKAVLALRLMLFTGAARQDVICLGPQNVAARRVRYRRIKTGGDVDLPMLDELLEVLGPLPADQKLFLVHTGGRPYKPETFANWFKEQCQRAGLPHCSPHGIRKAGATRLANAGGTEFEVMAFLGHRTPYEARTYTKMADRARLGDSGMAKVRRAKQEQDLSNRVDKLDEFRAKQLR